MDEEDTNFLRDSYQMLQNIILQNNSVYLSPPANSIIQSNHYLNGGECNGLVQLSEITSQLSSQSYGSVGEKYTIPQETNENEMDEILTCRSYKDQNKVKSAWKEVSRAMSGINGKNLRTTITWSCSYKNVL